MSNDIPNFNLLAVFAAVMEKGSLSKAAHHLNTNQSTISTALSRLKKEVGQELFIRSGRGVVPTAYSSSLYSQIQAPIHELNNVFQSMGQFDVVSTERKFVVSAPEHMQWKLLDHFSNLPYKGISLEVYDQPDDDEKIYDELLTQKFDAMIDLIVPNHSNIASQKLFDSEFVIVCSDDHPRIQGSITEEEYMFEAHALLQRKRKQMYTLGHYTSLDVSKRKVAAHGHSLFGNMLLCSQSEYLAVVPFSMALQFKKRLSLQIFKPPFAYVPLTNYLLWLKKHTNDAAHHWLREELNKVAAQMVLAKKDVNLP